MKHDLLLIKVTVPKVSKRLVLASDQLQVSVKPMLGTPASMSPSADIPSMPKILESVIISFQMSNNSQPQLPNTLYLSVNS